jgi:hypothetical protein
MLCKAYRRDVLVHLQAGINVRPVHSSGEVRLAALRGQLWKPRPKAVKMAVDLGTDGPCSVLLLGRGMPYWDDIVGIHLTNTR